MAGSSTSTSSGPAARWITSSLHPVQPPSAARSILSRRVGPALIALLALQLAGNNLVWGQNSESAPPPGKEAPAETPAAAQEQPASGEVQADPGEANKPASEDSKPPVGTADPFPETTPAEEWESLTARRWEIARELQRIKSEFNAESSRDKKKQLRTEFQNLLFEWNYHVVRRLESLATQVYAADPKNLDAGEFVMRKQLNASSFREALATADSLLESGSESAYVLNQAGIAACQLEEYERAQELFQQADTAGKLDRSGALRYMQLADAHIAQKAGELDADGAKLIIEDDYLRNEYQQAIELAEAQIEAGNKSPSVIGYLAAARFALNEFDKADQALQLAGDEIQLNSQGLSTKSSLEQYKTYWEREQQLRAAERSGDNPVPEVVLKTDRGDIKLALCENEAPNTVANFISLIEAGKYDGVAFHRVVPNFVIQGGDPNSLDDDPGNDGMGGPGYTIACECWEPDARKHFRGSLSMAHSGRDTGGSQFFITHRPTAFLNADDQDDTAHTVFGYVLSGMEVVDAIEKGDRIIKAEVLKKRDHEYKPETMPDPTLPATGTEGTDSTEGTNKDSESGDQTDDSAGTDDSPAQAKESDDQAATSNSEAAAPKED